MELISISPAQAIGDIDAGRVTVVDVREPDEYAAGHVPGALLLPLGQVPARAADVLPDKAAPIFVYCRTGRRSEAAGRQLLAMGYQNVKNLGGILSWPYELES